MLNLTTYRRDQFARLKDRLKNEGYDYTSALSLTSTAEIAQQAGERSMAVDISSLISLPDSSGGKAGIVATFEALLYQMPKSTVFVADETAANKYAYEMRTIFDAVQPCDIENNSEDQAVLCEEKPKRLIDLDDSEAKNCSTSSHATSSDRNYSKVNSANRSRYSGCLTVSASSRFSPYS